MNRSVVVSFVLLLAVGAGGAAGRAADAPLLPPPTPAELRAEIDRLRTDLEIMRADLTLVKRQLAETRKQLEAAGGAAAAAPAPGIPGAPAPGAPATPGMPAAATPAAPAASASPAAPATPGAPATGPAGKVYRSAQAILKDAPKWTYPAANNWASAQEIRNFMGWWDSHVAGGSLQARATFQKADFFYTRINKDRKLLKTDGERPADAIRATFDLETFRFENFDFVVGLSVVLDRTRMADLSKVKEGQAVMLKATLITARFEKGTDDNKIKLTLYLEDGEVPKATLPGAPGTPANPGTLPLTPPIVKPVLPNVPL